MVSDINSLTKKYHNIDSINRLKLNVSERNNLIFDETLSSIGSAEQVQVLAGGAIVEAGGSAQSRGAEPPLAPLTLSPAYNV